MNTYLISFLLYAVPANLLAAMFVVGGSKRVQWHVLEYPFIYLPWVALVVLVKYTFVDLEQISSISGYLYLIVILQSIGAGAMGGFVPLLRIFFPTDDFKKKLLLSAASGLLFATIYVLLRTLLFFVIKATTS